MELAQNKVECVYPIVIWSEFRIGKYRDDDNWEDAPHFRKLTVFESQFLSIDNHK